MFYSYLESVGMWEIMQRWSASESESLKFSICIPVYSPYTSWTTRDHIIPSKLSRRSDRAKSTQDYFPWLLSLSDVFNLAFASATSGSLKQWASYVYLSSGCKVSYLTKHKQNGLGHHSCLLNRKVFTPNMEKALKQEKVLGYFYIFPIGNLPLPCCYD